MRASRDLFDGDERAFVDEHGVFGQVDRGADSGVGLWENPPIALWS